MSSGVEARYMAVAMVGILSLIVITGVYLYTAVQSSLQNVNTALATVTSGKNGTNGINGINGTNGSNGKDGKDGVDFAQVLVVQKAPGTDQFSSVNAALATISDNSASKRYTIWVGPGTYTESQIQMKPYVEILGFAGSTVLTPADPSVPFILATNFCVMENIAIIGVTGNSAILFADGPADSANAPFLMSQVSFANNETHFEIQANTKTATSIIFNCISSGTASQYVKITSAGVAGKVAGLACFDTLWSSASPPVDGAYIDGPGAFMTMQGGSLFNSHASLKTGNGLHVSNGGLVRSTGMRIAGFARGIWVENDGIGPTLQMSSVLCDSNTMDLVVDHPDTKGALTGEAERTKSTVNDDASAFSALYNDPVEGSTVVLGELYLGPRPNALTDVSALIFDGSTMGLIEGGELVKDTGLKITVKEGMGYAVIATEQDAALQVKWPDTSLTLPANATSYVFFKDDGSLNTSLSQPNFLTSIILGRVATDATDVLWIDQSSWKAYHAANFIDNYQRTAFGAVYVSGSLITVNGSDDHKIDVGQGEYFLSQNQFNPSGGTAVDLVQYYLDSPSTWTQTTSPTVLEKYNDATTGGLKDLNTGPDGEFTRNAIYVVGDGANETYMMVYGTETFADYNAAVAGDLPLPPPDFTEGVVLIGSIVVQWGQGIIAPAIDNRPLVASRAQATATTNYHGNLLGLAADDHKQYLLVNGTRAMSGNLNMGTFAITNASTYNGVTVEAHASRHQPNGADPIPTAAAVSLTAASTNTEGTANTLARSDHTHQITGFITTVENEGTGTGLIYDTGTSTTAVAKLRSLLQDGTVGKEGIEVTTSGTEIVLGNTLSASNLVGGEALFTSRTSGTNPRLEFKSIAGSTGVTVGSTANTVTIGLSDVGPGVGTYNFSTVTLNAQGQVTAAASGVFANVGGGAGEVWRDLTDSNKQTNFRTLIASTTTPNEGIVVSTVGDNVVIGNTLTAENLGTVANGLFAQRTAASTPKLQFKSLTAGSGITLTPSSTDVDIALTPVGGGLAAGSYRLTNLTVDTFGRITAAANGGFGGVIMVDTVNGTASGALNGAPFKTISQALAVAVSGNLVLVYPGTYTETISIPAGVTVQGASINTVTIQQLTGNISANTDLVTMTTGSVLSNVSLVMTSAGNFRLRGIVLGETSTALVQNVNVTISAADATGPTCGLYCNAVTAPGSYNAVQGINISVTNTGVGNTRGILLDTAGNLGIAGDSRVVVVAANAVFAAAVETNHASANIFILGGILNCSTVKTANGDISQTLGTITLAGTKLMNCTSASGRGFSAGNGSFCRDFGEIGTLSLTATPQYYFAGTNTPSPNIIQWNLPQKCILRAISVRAFQAGTSTNVVTFTVQQNGSNTSMAVALSAALGTNLTNSATTNTVTFNGTSDTVGVSAVSNVTGLNPIHLQGTLFFYG